MAPADDRPPDATLFDRLYSAPEGVPWDIGRHQPELCASLWRGGEVLGPRVLDIGCGTGDNAVLLAMHGFHVTAFDFHPKAVELARKRVVAAGELRGSVVVYEADALRLDSAPAALAKAAPFDTAIDSAVLHCIGDDATQERYIAALGPWVRPGGHFIVQAVSDENPDPWEGPPRRISEARARTLLCETSGWRIDGIRSCFYENRMGFEHGSCAAIFAIATRMDDSSQALGTSGEAARTMVTAHEEKEESCRASKMRRTIT